mmetsp:Transcript_51940/g.121599  ORF Transcript_51940/g.121599 Transcript_51940/m.121599 type:complete len:178 (+) Transcript_51940:3433-3966(+)
MRKRQQKAETEILEPLDKDLSPIEGRPDIAVRDRLDVKVEGMDWHCGQEVELARGVENRLEAESTNDIVIARIDGIMIVTEGLLLQKSRRQLAARQRVPLRRLRSLSGRSIMSHRACDQKQVLEQLPRHEGTSPRLRCKGCKESRGDRGLGRGTACRAAILREAQKAKGLAAASSNQ